MGIDRKIKQFGVLFLAFLVFAVSLPTNTVAQTVPPNQPPSLEKLLTVESVILGIQDNMSLYYQNLQDSTTVSFSPERSWVPASTIKAYVVLEAYRQRRLGMVDFNQTITIKGENVVPTELETDEYPTLTDGVQVTIKQLIGAMVTQSDNTAYNTLLDILDRRTINSTLQDYGLTETIVGEKLNLDDSQLARDLAVPGRRPNTTTAKDFATFFNLLYTHKVLDAEEILDVFRHQKLNSMIPAYLPKDTVVAHKTGDWAPIYHDGGIVYKPNDPFILSVFTNSNDVHAISKIAQVAYYQDEQYVGKAAAYTSVDNTLARDAKLRYLAFNSANPVQVLSATDEKFPKLTAADLGITPQDVKIDSQDLVKIRPASIVPGSILYPIKRIVETVGVTISYPNKADREIAFAKSRLAEAKTVLQHDDITKTNTILSESEKDLQKAGAAVNGQDKQTYAIEIKQVNDLHYALLSQNAGQLTGKSKTAFVDMVYNFYQKDKTDVLPIVNSAVVANPINQTPLIGTVQKVSRDSVTVKLADGTTKTIIQNDITPIRDFHRTDLTSAQSIPVGSQIAVLGQTTATNTIVPQFILTNVPKQIPQNNAGIVLSVDPAHNTLQMQNAKGQMETINVSDSTVVRSRDTAVSLEGIIVGSHVTIFGDQNGTKTPISPPSSPSSFATASASLAPILRSVLPSALPQSFQAGQTRSNQPISSFAPIVTTLPSAKPVSSTPPAGNQQTSTGQSVNATTITITTNSPGTNQVIVPAGSPSTTPKATSKPAPKQTAAPKTTSTPTTSAPKSTPKPSVTGTKSASSSGQH